ncbi:carbohydrate ABC transporter permease [Paenibacillus riograndensis]|uniref:Binding-protein-dependent transporters inner membrane component n=1 Tax=Paenibacillus riograndensis SBR5 TaxID=1073571 RepID=A0A0E4CU91_9BACL|nr:carbohydrate ABC transporter permease [Paenibacillus riograndensis]CQR51654.1 binding-protein-dependent transporters inner membrane component [Paenibacillus riograndensis SBR5]
MVYKKSFFTKSIIYIVLIAIAVVDFYPIVYMGMNSMRTSVDFFKNPGGFPESFNFLNFEALYLQFDVLRLFGNTLFCVAVAFVLTMALSIPAAYAFSKMSFPYRSALYLLMIATMTIPSITFIVPNFLLMSQWGLVDHFLSVILMWAITSISSNVFLLTSQMRGIPNEILEASQIDGIGYFQTLWRLIIPLSVPGIMTLAIFNSTVWWNDLFTPLIFLQSDELKTMTVAVATILKRFDTDYPLLLAGLFMTSLPPMLIYIGLQKYIRKGLVTGSVK